MRKIPIENLLLPKTVEVAKGRIRMFEKEGEKLSSEYTNLFKKGEVVSNSTKDNEKGEITVLTKQQIPTAKLHQLHPKFIKAYREGRVITNLPDGILNIPFNSKETETSGSKKSNKKYVKINRNLFENVLNKMKSNKELMKERKEFLDLTKGNDKFHTIDMKYKIVKVDAEGKKEEEWYLFKPQPVFTAPVLRAFFQLSTNFEKNKIIYDFRRYGSNGIETINYDSLIKFLEFVNNKNLSTVKKHTPDLEKRNCLKQFVEKVDYLLNIDSATLVEIHAVPSKQLNTDDMTSPVSLTEMAVQNIEGKYINSKYFVSELTTIEDDKFVYPNENFEEEFSICTNGGNGNRKQYRENGIQYMKQSCLVTCVLLHMYTQVGDSKGKVKWWNHNSLQKYPPPSYQSISEMCGVPFQNDGHLFQDRYLPMSLTQLEPFLEHYSMSCYAITPMGDLVYRYNPVNIVPKLKERLGVCGLTLIISNGHVNQIPSNLATSFAGTYKDSEPLVCDTKNKLIYEFYQHSSSKPNTADLVGTFKKFPIRKSFDPSKGFAVDTKMTNIEKDSKHMADTIRKEVEDTMKTISSKKSKKKIIAKKVLISYHYIGCQVSIIECLKTKHNYIANNLILSGAKCDIIQSFDISYSNPFVKATLRIGNMLQAGLEYNDAEVVANIVKTEDQMLEYNSEFKQFYQKLYNKETIQTYSENLLENLLSYPCPPKGFSIMESYNSNEILQREHQENTERAEDGREPLNPTELEEVSMVGGVKRVGAIDANKAYASNMLIAGCAVTFPPYSGFVSKSVKISKKNIHEIKDYNLYRVTGQLKGDIKGYLMFDKKDIIYYGIILKEMMALLPDFTFSITAMCTAYKVVKIDWSSDIKRLYANTKLTTKQKKAIPNVLLGCCDKYRSLLITGECFHSKDDADAFYNISTNRTRILVAKKRNEETDTLWGDCENELKMEQAKQLKNENDGYDMYTLTNDLYQEKVFKLHINVNEKKESLFNQGFLNISVMKYNTQRLSLLKWWIKIEKSGTLLPIGVKTDSIFVCENNELNRELLNGQLNFLGFKGYEEVM